MKIQSLHHARLNLDANNPREVAFAVQWGNEHQPGCDTLSLLFRVPCAPEDPECYERYTTFGVYKLPLGHPTKRDRIIALTLIQWLGSNCGMSLIESALSRCGYTIRRDDALKEGLALTVEKEGMQIEIERLREKNISLEAINHNLGKDIDYLKADLSTIKSNYLKLKTENTAKDKEIAALTEKVQELEEAKVDRENYAYQNRTGLD